MERRWSAPHLDWTPFGPQDEGKRGVESKRGGQPQEEAFLAHESREALHRSLATLFPRQRLAVVLRYFQEMSARAIGAADK